ncbi:Hypothetical protein GSB_151815 [Giardia duodenalis]|uniref:Uncharacterized protein n=1 Tax=Giardia intestinalis TaxID=5741 RepID=V6U0D7_GIAIN|nr:Hypothetical protein GSB_151815 [Giardia intestinalis]
MLLRPAFNHRILLCSPNTVPPRGPVDRLQRHSPPHMTPVYPYKVPTTRGEVAVHRTRGTLKAEPTLEQVSASRRPETVVSPMGRPERVLPIKWDPTWAHLNSLLSLLGLRL